MWSYPLSIREPLKLTLNHHSNLCCAHNLVRSRLYVQSFGLKWAGSTTLYFIYSVLYVRYRFFAGYYVFHEQLVKLHLRKIGNEAQP